MSLRLRFSSEGFADVYFLTVCAQERGKNQLANSEVWEVLRESVVIRNQNGTWNCSVFLAMPDHVHLLVGFEGKKRMASVIPQWKRWIANQAEVKWQRDFFDHRLRSFESAAQKARYIAQNPERAGLLRGGEDWPYYWQRSSLKADVR